VLGLALRSILPASHLRDDSKETIKLAAGMIATMAALVLGLLVSSAKGSFDAINAGFTQAAAKIIQLDRVLAHYGPETRDLREQLRRAVAGSIERIWPAENTGVSALTAAERSNGIEMLQESLRVLTPQTDAQRQLLAQAQQLASDVAQTRWLMIEQAQNSLPAPLLVVLIFWLSMLFASFGLFAPRHGTVVVVLLICALSVSGAIFLILELNRPLDSVIKVSSVPMRKAMELIGQ
jgi:hypothetical protein